MNIEQRSYAERDGIIADPGHFVKIKKAEAFGPGLSVPCTNQPNLDWLMLALRPIPNQRALVPELPSRNSHRPAPGK